MISNFLRVRLARKSGYKWLALGLVTNMAFLNYLDRVTINSLFPLLRKDLGATDVQLGLMGTAFLVTYGVLSPLAGALGDRFSRRRVLLASLFTWSLVTLFSGFATSASYLILLRALLAIGQVAEIPVGQALVADFHARGTRARATSIHLGGTTVGIILSGIVAGAVGQPFGWRAVFVLLGLVGLASWVFTSFLLADPIQEGSATASGAVSGRQKGRAQETQETLMKGILQILRIPSVWAIMSMFFFTGLANWTVLTWLPLFLYESHGRTLVRAGFEANFFSQISGVTILAWAWLSDRWSSKNPGGCLWTQVLGLLLGVIVTFLLGIVQSQWALVICLLGVGVVMAAVDATTMPVLCEVVSPSQRSTAYGFLNLCGTIAGAIASYFVGLSMKRLGLGAIISSTSLFYFIAALAMCWAGWSSFAADAKKVRVAAATV
ncbi:MAG: MFS transporter [Acidobacteria bacterium]|nr:MFS transporter [Acidobacteriota bacterium]